VLSVRRLLNLIYYWSVRGADAESRADLDDALVQAGRIDLTARWTQAAQPPAEHVPGTAPRHIRAPSWWKGNRQAFRSSVKAAQQLGEPAAMGVDVRRAPPAIGRRPAPAGR
jgi:hypothetical protein